MILWFALVAGLLGFLAFLGLVRKRKTPYFAAAEYWVYLPGTELPAQQAIMHRMLAANPYGRPGDPPVGRREGLIFSDVRLHIALVLKSKNPHAFGSSSFSEDLQAQPGLVGALARCESFAKIRFISEQPLPDQRHITFLAHAADAVAELGGGEIVYDLQQERLMTREELSEALRAEATGTDARLHVRVLWRSTGSGGRAETRGLRKIGQDELVTAEMEPDERVLVMTVIDEAARHIWTDGGIGLGVDVNAFDDMFKVKALRSRDGQRPVQILRVQST